MTTTGLILFGLAGVCVVTGTLTTLKPEGDGDYRFLLWYFGGAVIAMGAAVVELMSWIFK